MSTLTVKAPTERIQKFIGIRNGVWDRAKRFAETDSSRLPRLFGGYLQKCIIASGANVPELRALGAVEIANVIMAVGSKLSERETIEALEACEPLISDTDERVRYVAMQNMRVSIIFEYMSLALAERIDDSKMTIGEIRVLAIIVQKLADVVEGWKNRVEMETLENAVDMVAYKIWIKYERTKYPDIHQAVIHALMSMRGEDVANAFTANVASLLEQAMKGIAQGNGIFIVADPNYGEVLEFVRARKIMQSIDPLLELMRFIQAKQEKAVMSKEVWKDITKTLLVLGVPITVFGNMLPSLDGFPNILVNMPSELLQ